MIFGDPPYKKFLVTKRRDHIHGSAGVQVTAAYKTRDSAVLTEEKISYLPLPLVVWTVFLEINDVFLTQSTATDLSC